MLERKRRPGRSLPILACLLAAGAVALACVPSEPERVQGVACRAKPGKIDIVWESFSGAQAYRVLRHEAAAAVLAAEVADPVFADFGLVDGTTYTYTVAAVLGDGSETAPSDPCAATPGPRPTDGNLPPDITSEPVAAGEVGAAYRYDTEAEDPDPDDALVFSLSAGPSAMTIDPATGVVAWTPAPGDAGDHVVTVRVTDPGGLADAQPYVVSVADAPPPPNRPPAIVSAPVLAGAIGEPYAYDVDAADPDGDALVYALTSGPAGMAIDAGSGAISWTPSAEQAGDHPVSVRSSDPGGLFDEQTFAVTVPALPPANATPVVQARLAPSARPPRRFQTFFGEDPNRTGNPATLADDPLRPVSLPNTTATRDRFLRELAGDVRVEDFEGFADREALTTIPFGSDTARITSDAAAWQLPTGTFNGTYPTSGETFLSPGANSVGTLSLAFDVSVGAFGLAVTDAGDGLGQLSIRLVHEQGDDTILAIPHSVAEQAISGSAFFFGVITTERPIVSLEIESSVAADGWGADDVVVARPDQVLSGLFEGETAALAPAPFSDAEPDQTHTATVEWRGDPPGPGALDEAAGAGSVAAIRSYLDDTDTSVEVCVSDSEGATGCDATAVVVRNLPPRIECSLSGFRLLGVLNDGTLVENDPLTGAQTVIADTGLPSWGSLDWHPQRGKLYGIPTQTTDPRLATLDPATGAVEIIGPIVLDGAQVGFSEGMAFDPHSGQLIASVSVGPNTVDNDFTSELLVSVDPDTAVATRIAPLAETALSTTLDRPGEGDGDELEFVDGQLVLTDGAGAAPFESGFFRVDRETGAVERVVEGQPNLSSLAYDDSTGVLYSSINAPVPSLWRVDPATGSATAIQEGTEAGTLAVVPPAARTRLLGITGDGVLYEVDPLSGAQTEIGRNGLGSWTSLTFDPRRRALFSLLDFIEAPTLGRIDPATGEARAVGPITVGGVPVALAEGLAVAPDGRLLASVSLGTGVAEGDFYTETLVEIDPDTGAAVVLATLDRTIDFLAGGDLVADADRLVFVGSRLLLHDGIAGIPPTHPRFGGSSLFDVDPDTGDVSNRVDFDPVVFAGLADDPESGILYAISVREGAPGLYRVSPAGGATFVGDQPVALAGLAAVPGPPCATGGLYALSQGRLLLYDLESGRGRDLGTVQFEEHQVTPDAPTGSDSLTFDPVRGVLFAAYRTPTVLARIDPLAGTAFEVGPFDLTTGGSATAVCGLDVNPQDGGLYAAFTEEAARNPCDRIGRVDPGSGAITPLVTLSQAGSAGDFGTRVDADAIEWIEGSLYATDGTDTIGATLVYRIDLSTGFSELLGQLGAPGDDLFLFGLSYAEPLGVLFGASSVDQRLVTLDPEGLVFAERFPFPEPTLDIAFAVPPALSGRTTLAEGQASTLTLGFTDPGVLDTHTGTIDWGDGSVEPARAISANGSGFVGGSHVYVQDGGYPARFCVRDDDGGEGCTTLSVRVFNRPASLEPLADAALDEGELLEIATDFSDLGRADVHSAAIDWGDGTPEEPAPVMQAAGDGSVSASHVYAARGSYTATLCLDDGSDLACDAFEVAVNGPPAIVSAPPTETVPGAAYAYAVAVEDDPGDTLLFALDVAPAGMAVDPATGLVTWTPLAAQLGDQPVTVRVTDARGLSATQSFALAVVPDTVPPTVELSLSSERVDPGGEAILTVVASDNGAPPAVAVRVNGVPQALDANGQLVLPTAASGAVVVEVTVTDADGNVTAKTIALAVTDPSDTTPPAATLEAPDDLAEVTYLEDLIGTATDDHFFRYQVGVARGTDRPFTLLAQGFTPVVSDVLATFDPTLLENGIYRVRLVGEDVNGATAVDERSLRVTGAAKVGFYTLRFTDLVVPLAGIPIQVERIYDSRIKERRDFGVGWTLALARGSFTQNRPVGRSWQILDDPGPLGLPCRQVFETAPHQVEVRLSDREAYTFVPRLVNPVIIFGGCLADVEFELLTGPTTGATLQLLDGSQVFYELGTDQVLDPDTLTRFDPQRVRLTTLDGRVIDLDRAAGGVTRIADPRGNQLEIRAEGIVHSSGRSIAFGRDAAGRIETITDPEGGVLRYAYDGAGDLVAFTDRLGNESSYGYDGRHGLLEVRDPLGHRAIRTEYDAAGRIVRVTDATGASRSFDYDLAARVEVVSDARGNPMTYLYDERGNIVEEIDALGGRSVFEFDARDDRVSERDPLGRVTRIGYDANGNVLSVTDDLGEVQTFEYDAQGRPTSATNALGSAYHQSYSPLGLLESLVDAEGGVIELGYDVVGNLISRTDAAGSTSYEVDRFGNVVREVDALGQERLSSYDGNGRRTALSIPRTTPAGAETLTWKFVYDAEGRRVEREDPTGARSFVEYDALGHVVAEIDPLGRRTSYEYDAHGRRTRVVHPDGSVASFAYDATGNLVEEGDRAGRITRHEYDALNRRVATRYPDDTPGDSSDDPVVRWEYDAAGQLVAEVDPLGNRTEFEYDRAGRRVRTLLPAVIDPSTASLRRPELTESYDEAGNLVSTTDPLGRVTRFERDANGREVARILPDGTRHEIDRDARGLEVERRDALGFARRFERDAIGQLLGVEDPLGGVTRFGYDEVGNRVSQTDAAGRETRREFDGLGRETALARPLGEVRRRAYDAAGQLETLSGFGGTSLEFAYEEAGRLAEKLLPEGPVTFSYTRTGQVETVTDARGVTRYAYDARDRLVRRTEPDGREISYVYDAAGRRVEVRTARGTVRTGYDALGRISSVRDWDDRETRFSYDLSGALVRMERPNGTVLVRGVDAVGRTASLEERDAGGARLLRLDYGRDAQGRVVAVAREDGSRTEYEYDAIGRLVAERRFLPGAILPDREIRYELDAVGNRTVRNDSAQGVTLYSYDANDRLLREEGPGGVVDYAYDPRGNRIRRSAPAGTTGYRWDSEGHLVGVDLGEDGLEELRYAYDAFGDRVGETVLGAETRFLLDASGPLSEPLLETAADGSMLAAHVPGPWRVASEQGGALRFFHQDALGSVIALSDGLGSVTDRYAYDAFGVPESTAGSSPNRFRFAGEPYQPATGLLYLRARSYDPATGRFLGTDPEPGDPERPRSLHRFLYAGADPVNFRDPGGRQVTLIEVAVGEAEDEVFYAERLVAERQFGQQVLDLTYRAIGQVYGRVTANSLRLFTRIGNPRSVEALRLIRAEFRAIVGPLVNRNICVGAIEGLLALSQQLGPGDPLGEAIAFAFAARPDVICGFIR